MGHAHSHSAAAANKKGPKIVFGLTTVVKTTNAGNPVTVK